MALHKFGVLIVISRPGPSMQSYATIWPGNASWDCDTLATLDPPLILNSQNKYFCDTFSTSNPTNNISLNSIQYKKDTNHYMIKSEVTSHLKAFEKEKKQCFSHFDSN